MADDPKSALEAARRGKPPEYPIEQAWKEMDEFLERNRIAGPAKTMEEYARRNAEFLAIEKRRVEFRNRLMAAELTRSANKNTPPS